MGARQVAVSVLVALGVVACRGGRARDACSVAFDARDWRQVVARCEATDARARLGQAWLALGERRGEAALELAAGLAGTTVAIDALFLAGSVHARDDDPAEEALGRTLLWGALLGYQLLGRHRDASYAANLLSRVPRPSARFEDALALAELSVAEADKSGDAEERGVAETALAEVYDQIGMAEHARDGFVRAAGLLGPWPNRLARTYLNHGIFLLDSGARPQLLDALKYFDAATKAVDDAGASHRTELQKTVFALHLNRAVALTQLGRVTEAVGALDVEPTNAIETRRVALVHGYIAARRRDAAAAEALFATATADELDLDYRWRIALELAQMYRAAGRWQDAERAYRDAIASVEQLRRDTSELELRPPVLARRTQPYLGLLALLVSQGRGVDALVVAESLHARTWVDVVLGDTRRSADSAGPALLGARVHLRAAASPALDLAELTARIGAREALVFLSVGTEVWRVHVLDGGATVVPLTPDDVEAVLRFGRAPDDVDANERAAVALLPSMLVRSDEPLYIVASGPLADLSFAGLRRGGRFLIEDRPVARLPGLATLGCRPGAWTDERVFIGDAHRDLRLAADEVRRLAGPRARIGPDATIAAVEAARDAELLHAAVHGKLTDAGGALDLADGDFTSASVFDRRIGPRVVMLTGCATAASRDAEAWGGFPSAFLAAGSRFVVATLRSVEDADAAAFARVYYALPESFGPVARVAAAQRAALIAQRALMLERPFAAWTRFAVWGDAACDAVAGERGSNE